MSAQLLDRVKRTVAINRDETVRPLPPITVDLGTSLLSRTASARMLNLLVALLAFGCTAVLISHWLLWIPALLAIGAMAVRPEPGTAQFYAVLLGVGLALSTDDPWSIRSFLLLFGVHAMVQLGSLSQGLSSTTRVECAVLAAIGRRFAVVQIGAQAVAAAAAAIATRDVQIVWLSVAAGAALALLAWAVRAALTDGPS